MPRIGKNGIRYTDEGSHETRVHSHSNVRYGEAHARTNHADDTGDKDAKDARDGEPGEAVEGARERADEGWNGEDARIEHEAEFAIGERTEGNLAGEELAAGGEDGEDDGAEGEDFAADGAEEDEACIAHVVDLRCVNNRNPNFKEAFAKAQRTCFLLRVFWVGNGNAIIPSGCLNLN